MDRRDDFIAPCQIRFGIATELDNRAGASGHARTKRLPEFFASEHRPLVFPGPRPRQRRRHAARTEADAANSARCEGRALWKGSHAALWTSARCGKARTPRNRAAAQQACSLLSLPLRAPHAPAILHSRVTTLGKRSDARRRAASRAAPRTALTAVYSCPSPQATRRSGCKGAATCPVLHTMARRREYSALA